MTDPTVPTPYDVLGAGAGGPLQAPFPWYVTVGGLTYPGAVTIGNPTGGFQGAGSLNLQTLYLNGVNFVPANYLTLAGGTMAGTLTLYADPINTNDAATKHYIDTQVTTLNNTIVTYLPLAGGTITGNLTINGTTTLSADPTTNLGAATKQYVDTRFGSVITIPDAPADGSTYGRNNNAWSSVIDAGIY